MRSESSFGTEEPDKVTVVPICFAFVTGMMPAQMGTVMPAAAARSLKR